MAKDLRQTKYGCSMNGVRRVASHNPDCVIVLHSPIACGHIAREKDNGSYRVYVGSLEYEAPLVTTNLDDNAAIFGGENKLATCLEEVARKYKPKYILIANSCTVGIIGDDVASIAKVKSLELGLPILTVNACGFMNGGYETGVYEAIHVLMDTFVKPLAKKLDEVTLVGIIDKKRNNEYEQLKRLFGLLDIKINCMFPVYSSVEQMQNIGASQAIVACSGYNLVNRPFRKTAKELAERVQAKYIDIFDPIGFGATIAWLKTMGELLEIDEEKIAAAVEIETEYLGSYINGFKKYLEGQTAVLYIQRKPLLDFDANYFFELINMVGIKTNRIIFSEEFDEAAAEKFYQDYNLQVVGAAWELKKNYEYDSEEDFIFTIRPDGNKSEKVVYLPYAHPPFGRKGIDLLLEKMKRMQIKRRHRG